MGGTRWDIWTNLRKKKNFFDVPGVIFISTLFAVSNGFTVRSFHLFWECTPVAGRKHLELYLTLGFCLQCSTIKRRVDSCIFHTLLNKVCVYQKATRYVRGTKLPLYFLSCPVILYTFDAHAKSLNVDYIHRVPGTCSCDVKNARVKPRATCCVGTPALRPDGFAFFPLLSLSPVSFFCTRLFFHSAGGCLLLGYL